MALLEEIRAHLLTHGITPVAQDQLPDGPGQPDTVVALFATSGLEPDHTMGGGGGGSALLVNPGLQVLARGPRDDRKTARDLAHQVKGKLDGLTNVTLSGCRYVSVFAVNEPHLVELDENRRPVYACDFTISKEPS